MIAGDFDGNGKAEIVVSELNATTLTVLSLVGGQVTTQHIPATHLIQSLAACDVDGDGDLDIVAGDAGPSVLVNTGSGVFAPPVSYPGSGTQIIVPVDLDGNGLSDVAFVSPHYDFNYTPQAISVMTAGGGGSLLPATSYPVGHFTEGVTAGDFDGDGHMDLAATDALGCVRILLGQGNGLLEAITPIATVPNPDAIETGDLDGDGDADVVVADWNLPNVSVLLNQGGVLAAPVTYPLTAVADRIVLADLDADGDLDMALVGHVATAVFVLRNNGNGTFAPFAMYPTPFTTIDIAAGDVDGDGDVDLAILIGGSVSKLMMLLNNGAGVFTATPTQSLGSVVTGFALGDTNGDGAPDAVCSSSSAGALLLFRNSGSGMFTLQQSVNVGSSSRKVLLADLDADGDLDVGESILPDQVVICSNVNGVLQPPLMTRTGQNPGELRGADFDGDGLLDLATAGPAEAVSILRNQGSVLFDPPILRASYSTASYIAPADIDGDGYPDIVVSHGYRPSISLVHACSNQVGSFFCDGDGSATACPCGNASAVGADAGCLNSLGSGGTLRTHGYAHLGADTLVLAGGGMPSSFALYFQGTTEVNGGAGNVFGDGLRCAGGNVVRLGVELNSGGVSHYPSAGQQSVHVRGLVSSPGLRTYQVWYRNAASFCTPSTFNLTNGVRLNWVP